jgi:hypothetical protein
LYEIEGGGCALNLTREIRGQYQIRSAGEHREGDNRMAVLLSVDVSWWFITNREFITYPKVFK